MKALSCRFFFTHIFVICLFFFSCSSSKNAYKDIIYFNAGSDTISLLQAPIKIQAFDLLDIQVYSKTLNQDQAAIFNLPAQKREQSNGYQVDQKGEIVIPVLGPIKAAGLSRSELELYLEKQLTNYVKNPSVTVRLLQFRISVLGEVRSPGTQKFQTDKVTIIDALAAAGDLTDYGKRTDITVIREENGTMIYHNIDLSKKNVFQSTVYLLQPNDIVYVSPNKNKIKNLSVDPEKQRRSGLFLSIISVLISLATLIIFSVN